ncbi:MAG TPA: hypothetical protein VN625_02300, partial [Desulfuromonadaceae bacterium]|nr:hypothetical protein [Desulfuromonadaceae bacterium]
MRSRLWTVYILLLGALVSLHAKSDDLPLSKDPAFRTFAAKGIVQAIQNSAKTIVIRHEAIGG